MTSTQDDHEVGYSTETNIKLQHKVMFTFELICCPAETHLVNIYSGDLINSNSEKWRKISFHVHQSPTY